MEHYIREKYEKKSFMDSPKGVETVRIKKDGPGVNYGSGASAYRDQVAQLRDMGFTDSEASLTALRKTNGDVNAAINVLVKQSVGATAAAAPAPGHASMDQRISALESMGFKDAEANRRALAQTNGNVNEAVSLLVKGGVSAPAAKPAAAAAPSPSKPAANHLGDDLLGDFSAPAAAPPAGSSGAFGGFGDFGAAPPAAAAAAPQAAQPAQSSADMFAGAFQWRRGAA